MKKRKPALLIVFTFIIIYFLWQETFSSHKRINHDKVNALATTLVVVLTSIIVYFLFKQNEQNEKLIKAANKPDVYPALLNYTLRDPKETSPPIKLEHFQIGFRNNESS